MSYPDFNNPCPYIEYKYETSIMRIERLYHHSGETFTIVSDSENGVWVNFNKSKNFTSRTSFIENPRTELRECIDCGKISTPKKIQQRSLFGFRLQVRYSERYKISSDETSPMLCMGCYNKKKHLSENLEENEDMRLQLNRMKKEIRAIEKGLNNAT